jgi:hypothetical protein
MINLNRLGGSCGRIVASSGLALSLTACAWGSWRNAPAQFAPPLERAAGTKAVGFTHAIVGFSVDTPKRASIAAGEGIDVTILYGGSPAPASALAKALVRNGITVIDGGVSSEMFYWECHRTHTVKPPPSGPNDYCRTDENPRVRSEAVVLHDVSNELARDAHRAYVVGFWVLDDWPYWDAGSAQKLLQKIHALIAKIAPGEPAICGFGAGLAKPGQVSWDPGTAENYSNGGCDDVGWYVYAPFGRRHPSSGKRLDWSMKALLPAMTKSLAKYGWAIGQTPLLGIGQAWSGPYGNHSYQPGLSRDQMRTQATGFCAYGATSISWYAWDDSGFGPSTNTPESSTTIADGIAAGITACKKLWAL